MHPELHEVFAKAEEAAAGIQEMIERLWDAKDHLPAAERAYRDARWEAWKSCPQGLAKEREDYIDQATAERREERDKWELVRKGAIESLRAHQQTLSYYQTKARVIEAEADLSRYGGDR